MFNFNQLQDKLNVAVNQFEQHQHLQNVDGIVKFSELHEEFKKIHIQLSFLGITDASVNSDDLTIAVKRAASYVKQSSDQLLACDGKNSFNPGEVKVIEPATKASIFDQMNNFFRFSPVSVNHSPVNNYI